MTRAEITEMQRRIGTEPDGFWGQKSIAACQKHLRSLMPKPNPWPASDQKSLTAFYGQPGDESKLTRFDLPTNTNYDGKPARHARAHDRCVPSLIRILNEIASGPDAWVLRQYAGIYNNRPMRGGSLPSIHARGAAIDLAPGTNGNHTTWPTRATMPLSVMEAFAREGWLSAGAFWGRDAMHFQATR